MNMAAAKRPMIDKRVRLKAGPIFLFFGWLVAATVVLGAQLDRETRYRPGLAEYVPGPFRSFSQAVIVKGLLKDQADPVTTYVEASRLLLLRPMPADNLSLYALSAARAGKEDRALQALGLASARGWHNEVAQYAALDAAARTGDWPSASLRFRALTQIQARLAILGRATQSFMADPKGRTALVALVAQNPPFQYQLLSLAGTYGAGGTFPLFVSALKSRKERLDCGSLHVLVARWLALGKADLAIDSWSLCARDGAGAVNDLSFLSRGRDIDPFGWHLSDHPALSWSLDASGALYYRNKEHAPRLLAWRMLTLPAGLHRLKMEGHPAAMNGSYPSVRLRCVASGNVAGMESPPDDPRMLAVLVPEDCHVQKLEVKVLEGDFVGFRLGYL